MLIGMSMRITENSSYIEYRDSISHDWINYLNKYNISPILIPNNLNDNREFLNSVGISGIIISGGDSIIQHPTNPNETIYHQRDVTEWDILTIGIEMKLPILGTCRGFQMINKFFGGNITENISTTHKHTVAREHQIDILENPVTAGFLNHKPFVNSYHDDGVRIPDLSDDLTSFATWDDQIIEGFFHPHLPIIGIQWHPERSPNSQALNETIINYWINQCN
tara:strand:+ start:4410 stop:5075 length:666 start_codon:yes stop_codon:yes gene_type:complete